ncbi:MAG TPA: VWA domain-containing protein [Rhodanobacteraceae bacterium]|jgi:Ca-activated chloride channel family protein|nr:VWA domain-containing protein [Rhodanobacteraceae bacterium]
MTFAWPWMFALLPLPWLVWKFLPRAAPGAAMHLPQHVNLTALTRGGSATRSRLAVAALAWLLLVTAAARPQQPAPPQSLQRTGRALMLAVDCSGSMAIDDMQLGGQNVSRFAAVRAIASRFIAERSGDDVGLVLFGTHAYLLAPMTFDVHAVAVQMDGAAIGLAGRETAIGDAITLAVKHLTALPARARVLVLLTDGVNTAGSVTPQAAANLAKAAGVRIYTIGVGSAAGTINVFGMQLNAPDNALDTGVLKQIAQETGGRFFRASDGDQLASAYRTINALEPLAQGKSMLRPEREWYPWPLALALLLGCSLLPWRAAWARRAQVPV